MKALCEMIAWLLYMASLIYTFIVWGFWWGVLALIAAPIFPLIDIVKYLVTLAPWLK